VKILTSGQNKDVKNKKMRIITQTIDLDGCFRNIQASQYEIIKAYKLLYEIGVDTDESTYLEINGTIEDVVAMIIKAMRIKH
jgi:hypothetical protein